MPEPIRGILMPGNTVQVMDVNHEPRSDCPDEFFLMALEEVLDVRRRQ